MTNGRNAHLYIDGNAALKLDGFHGETSKATIIPFPNARREGDHSTITECKESVLEKAKAKIKAIAEGSEMYCSLRFEDFRGCPYRLFSTRGIAVLSVSTAVLAVASIVIGY